MVVCSGTIPARRIMLSPDRYETTHNSDGSITETLIPAVVEDQPEHPCTAPATMLARSIEQKLCNLGELHWVRIKDVPYCEGCYVPGTATDIDGRVTKHGAMSIEEYRG